jgi:hypothetical protein
MMLEQLQDTVCGTARLNKMRQREKRAAKLLRQKS